MASILETKSVTKKFGGFTAVDNVSLKVDSGEIRFVIGPNGAGKSTLFKLVIGFHSPNSGTILYKGKNVEKLKLHERINLGMGVKFQAPSVFSELTVLENLFLAIVFPRVPEEPISNILIFFWLKETPYINKNFILLNFQFFINFMRSR